MSRILLAAGAAALAIAAPAAADKGHGKGHDQHFSHEVHKGHIAANAWGRSCPPGLAKKHNGCLPPGIARQHYNVGQRWNGNYGLWSYNQVPMDWRSQYNLDPANRYYYRDGYLYSVDPRTRLVESVIQALIR
jgi:hypothetical protein